LNPKSLNFLCFALFSVSCTDSNSGAGIIPAYDKETGKLQRLDYDSDKDGRVDTVSYMDGQKVVRIEIDKNQDGQVERWEHYDQNQKLERVGFSRSNDGKEDAWSYQGSDGTITRIDVSAARDGKVSRREFYEKEVLVRAEETDPSTAGDTWKPSRWEAYDPSGRLVSAAFDSTGRGTPDRRLIYDADGTVRLELDPDGDSRFEPSR
jgi:hypothetical protein